MLGICLQFLQLLWDYSNTNTIVICSSLVYDSAEPQRQTLMSILFHIFHNCWFRVNIIITYTSNNTNIIILRQTAKKAYSAALSYLKYYIFIIYRIEYCLNKMLMKQTGMDIVTLWIRDQRQLSYWKEIWYSMFLDVFIIPGV